MSNVKYLSYEGLSHFKNKLDNTFIKQSPANYYMTTNSFNNNSRVYINYLSDFLHAADKRFNISIIGNNGDNLSSLAYKLFDGSYESYIELKNNATYIITISAKQNNETLSTGYHQGHLFLAFYWNYTNISSISARVYTYGSTNFGTQWWKLNDGQIISGSHSGNNLVYKFETRGIDESDNLSLVTSNIQTIEFTIKTAVSGKICLTAIDYQITRPAINQLPVITKYGQNTLYHDLTVNANIVANTIKGNLDWSYIQNKPTIDTHTSITNVEIDTIFTNTGF